jgi:hypothetical protein
MTELNETSFIDSLEYHAYFQRKIHNIVKLTAMMDNLFPWADAEKTKIMLEIYENLRYNIEKDFKKENNIEDEDSNKYVYLSESKIKNSLKEAIKEWDQEVAEEIKKSNKCSVTYTINVQEDEHGPLIELPPEVIEELGWKENDIVTWHIKEDGSVIIEKEVYNEAEDN